MPKMVIEVPEELREVGQAMAGTLAALERTLARSGGGKALEYSEVESAVSEEASGIERSAHRAILQSLDIDVPVVVIGGVRYTRVGRCEAYRTTHWPVRYRSSDRCTVNPGSGAGSPGEGWLTR